MDSRNLESEQVNVGRYSLKRPISSILGLFSLPMLVIVPNILLPILALHKSEVEWNATIFAVIGTDLLCIPMGSTILMGSSMINSRRILFYAKNGEWARVRKFFTNGFPLLPQIYRHPVTTILRDRSAGDGFGLMPSEYDTYFEVGPDGGARLSTLGAAVLYSHLERDFAQVGLFKICVKHANFMGKNLPCILGMGVFVQVLLFLGHLLWDMFHPGR